MASILDSIAGTIHGAFKNIFYDATLTRYSIPESPAFDPADPPAPVPTNYPCKALRDSYSSYDKQDSDIAAGDVKILILAQSISVAPVDGDNITISNPNGGTYRVINANIDPANALWIVQGRN